MHMYMFMLLVVLVVFMAIFMAAALCCCCHHCHLQGVAQVTRHNAHVIIIVICRTPASSSSSRVVGLLLLLLLQTAWGSTICSGVRLQATSAWPTAARCSCCCSSKRLRRSWQVVGGLLTYHRVHR